MYLVPDHCRSKDDDRLMMMIVVSYDLWLYVLHTWVKRWAELSTDHYLVASWIRWQGRLLGTFSRNGPYLGHPLWKRRSRAVVKRSWVPVRAKTSEPAGIRQRLRRPSYWRRRPFGLGWLGVCTVTCTNRLRDSFFPVAVDRLQKHSTSTHPTTS